MATVHYFDGRLTDHYKDSPGNEIVEQVIRNTYEAVTELLKTKGFVSQGVFPMRWADSYDITKTPPAEVIRSYEQAGHDVAITAAYIETDIGMKLDDNCLEIWTLNPNTSQEE